MASFVDFVIAFQRALKASQLYSPAHPRYMESLEAFGLVFEQFLQGRAQIQIAARNGRIFVDRQMEDADNLQVRALAGGLEERSIHALVLYQGVELRELDLLLAILSMRPAALRALGGAKKHLEDSGVTRIQILATRLDEVSEAGEVIAAAFLGSMARLEGSGMGGPGGFAAVSGAGAGSGAGRSTGPGAGEGGGEAAGKPGHKGKGKRARGSGPGQDSTNPSFAGVLGRAQAFLGGLMGSAAVEGPAATPGLPRGVAGSTRGTGQDLASVAGQVQAFLGALAAGGLATADMSGFADYLEGMGLDRQGSQPSTQGVISKAVSSLGPLQQLGVFLGSGDLRPGPLRNVFGRLSATLAAPSLASAFAQGAVSAEQLTDVADQMKAITPSVQSWVAQLTETLRREGMSETQLKDLVDILTWESRPLEERIKVLLEGQRIFEMPSEKVLAFLRELLEAGRNTEFLRLMRHFATGLSVPAVTRRLAVAQSFEKIADWVDIPGMPTHILEELMGTLSRTYGREKDPEVHRWFSLGMEHILWFFMESGELLRACHLLDSLQDVVSELSLPAAWKEQGTVDLLQRLCAPQRLEAVLAQLFVLDPAEAADQVHPLIARLGPAVAAYLVERLSQEPDRNHRRRLLEALKVCGHVAETPLLESLKSGEWFVVRNALIVLGEVAGPERVPQLEPFLDYADPRVRLAAVRALGHIGGREAEVSLTRLLARPDPELQLEILFILDELKDRNAIPALLDLAKPGKARNRSPQDKVREKALEVLGHLGSAAAIPLLAELASRQKKFFRDVREPLPIRLAALRALQALGSAEGQEAIRKALATEPAGPERDALKGALD